MWDRDHLAHDVAAGDWIDNSIREFIATAGYNYVGSIIPSVFESYARVLHRPSLYNAHSGSVIPRRWKDIASANQRVMHPLVEWQHLIPSKRELRGQSEIWNIPPSIGGPDSDTVDGLKAVLKEFTSSPEVCWFAIWEGHSSLEFVRDSVPLLRISDRNYLIVRDSIEGAGSTLSGIAPSFWWPEHREWCVSSDIDLMATYVGGTRECVNSILSRVDLESFLADPSDSIIVTSDTVNPPPV